VLLFKSEWMMDLPHQESSCRGHASDGRRFLRPLPFSINQFKGHPDERGCSLSPRHYCLASASLSVVFVNSRHPEFCGFFPQVEVYRPLQFTLGLDESTPPIHGPCPAPTLDARDQPPSAEVSALVLRLRSPEAFFLVCGILHPPPPL